MNESKCTVTVLSPVYNKAATIVRSFESLLKQTNYDFEWLVINDGSKDNSAEIIKTFKTDLFPIRFYDKENEGLNRTFNMGIRLAKGDLVLRLDTDDYLLSNAIEQIVHYYDLIRDDNSLCSVAFLTGTPDGCLVGTHPYKDIHRSNFIDYRYLDHAKGDRKEVVKREVFSEFPMLEIEGEKFCSESVMWQNIAEHYDALYIPEIIYIKEYGGDSISANHSSVYSRNPMGVRYGYLQSVRILLDRKKKGYPVMKELLKTCVNYYRYSPFYKESAKEIFRGLPLSLSLVTVIPGLLCYLIDKFFPSLIYKLLGIIRGTNKKMR